MRTSPANRRHIDSDLPRRAADHGDCPARPGSVHVHEDRRNRHVGSNAQTIVLCGPNVPTTINNSGTVAFQVENSGGIGQCTSGGGYGAIWTGNGSTPLLIFPLDDSGFNGPNGLGPGAVIASGEVAFVVPDPGTFANHLYLGNGGPPTLVANGPFPIWFVAADDSGAVAVVSEGAGGGPSAVLRYDAPSASPVVIDSDVQNLYGPVRAINAGLEVAFAKEDSSTFQRTRVLKGSGGQLTTIGQAGNSLNGMTLEIVGQYVAIRDDGFVAFQGLEPAAGHWHLLGQRLPDLRGRGHARSEPVPGR